MTDQLQQKQKKNSDCIENNVFILYDVGKVIA